MVTDIIKAAKELYPIVTEELSRQLSKKYDEDTKDLGQLDKWRLETLPAVLKQRYEEGEKDEKKTWLDKKELQLLMDWKLAKGKFRPTLPKLIASNEDDAVVEATTKGLSGWLAADITEKTDKKKYIAATKQAIKDLSSLKGVGPATATLMLSLLSDIHSRAPPYFSDEAFLYYVVEPQRPGTKIKYSVPEYCNEYLPLLLDIKTEGLLQELERGGWALKMYDLHDLDSLSNLDRDLLPKFSSDTVYKLYTTDDNDDEKPDDPETKQEDTEDEKPLKKRKVES